MDGLTKKLGRGGANWPIISINPLKNMINHRNQKFTSSFQYLIGIKISLPSKLIGNKEPEKFQTKKNKNRYCEILFLIILNLIQTYQVEPVYFFELAKFCHIFT
jgi:hypothetical protein